MKKILYVVFIAVILTSCGNEKQQKYIHNIDSLYTIVDTISNNLQQMKKDTLLLNAIKQSKNHSKALNPFLDTLFTMSSYRKRITEYMAMYKFFKKFKNHWGELYSNVEYTKKQLRDLKHDIPILLNKGDTVNTNKYLKDETNAVKIISEKYEELKKGVSINMNKFPEANKKITNLLDSLKQ